MTRYNHHEHLRLVLTFIGSLLLSVMFQTASAAPALALTKSVDEPNPTSGVPVEFSIVVRNTGDEEVADIVVADELPPGLEHASGLGIFVSQGSFDEETGEWAVGSLAVEQEATLLLPAAISLPTTAPCLVNEAAVIAASPTDAIGDAGVDASAVYLNGNQRCVDLVLHSRVSVINQTCRQAQAVEQYTSIENRGPDVATDVRLTHSASTTRQSASLYGGRCEAIDDEVCVISSIDVGEIVFVTTVHDFELPNEATVVFDASVSAGESERDQLDNSKTREVTVPREIALNCDNTDTWDWGPAVAPGCFIATAAYGSDLEPEVATLRRFRDQYLVTNALGRLFVHAYYVLSPPVAEVIARSESLRATTRTLLRPLVFAIHHPYRALVLSIAIVTLLVSVSRRKRTARVGTLR